MTKFERPKSKNWDYPDMAREAGIYPLSNMANRFRRKQLILIIPSIDFLH